MPSAEPLGESDSADSNSEVLKFFTKYDDDDDDEPVAVCNQYGCNFNANIGDYVRMWNHLSGSHAEIYKGTTRYKTTPRHAEMFIQEGYRWSQSQKENSTTPSTPRAAVSHSDRKRECSPVTPLTQKKPKLSKPVTGRAAKQETLRRYEMQLIAAVRDIPQLYDSTREDYVNKDHQCDDEQCWMEVAEKIRGTPGMAKGTWAYLRTMCNTLHLKETRTGKQPTDPRYKAMIDFLLPFIRHKKDTPNAKKRVSVFGSAHEPRRSRRLRVHEGARSADSDTGEIHCDESLDDSGAPSSPLPDEYELYFKALQSTYRVLSAEQKRRARVQLKNIIAAESEVE